MKTVVIIGAGPAGLMAAVGAAQKDVKVILIEKNNIVGKKMGITGKGRCNITNVADTETFIKNTPGNGKFLYSIYKQFDNKDLINMLNKWGLETKIERGGRVFPLSDSAIEVRKFFYKKVKDFGISLKLEEVVKDITLLKDNKIEIITDKNKYLADACVIATGGVSYPVTGSTGDGYKFAEKLGHTVTELKPSLVPLIIEESWIKDLQGLSLKNVEVSLWADKKLTNKFGEMIFTHFGVSGPIILSISNDVVKHFKKKKNLHLSLDLKPALTEEKLLERLKRDFDNNKLKMIKTVLITLLPKKIIPIILTEAKINPEKSINQITKSERLNLLKTIKSLKLTIVGTEPISKAIITAGGVNIKEINSKTLASKIFPNIFFAGEVLDVDAYTGGFNLQIAFSTGYVAGKNIGIDKGDKKIYEENINSN